MAEPAVERNDGGGRQPRAEVIDFPVSAVLAPGPRAAPAPAGPVPKRPGERRPIIPAQWQRASAGATLRHHASLAWHRARFHGLRTPAYLVQAIGWAIVGAARLALAQLAWWWVAEQTWLRSEAIAAGDHRAWMTLHKHARETRL